jgi:hypothetical protein
VLGAFEKFPSPNIHWYVKVGGPVEALVNEITAGAAHTVGMVDVKLDFTPGDTEI